MSISFQQCGFFYRLLVRKSIWESFAVLNARLFYKYKYFTIKVIYTIMGWVFFFYKTTFKAFPMIKNRILSVIQKSLLTLARYLLQLWAWLIFYTDNSNIPLTWKIHVNQVTHAIWPSSRPHQYGSINTHMHV